MTDLELKGWDIAIDWLGSGERGEILGKQIAIALREARNAALEEAAGVADDWDTVVAERIRALKDTTPSD